MLEWLLVAFLERAVIILPAAVPLSLEPVVVVLFSSLTSLVQLIELPSLVVELSTPV